LHRRQTEKSIGCGVCSFRLERRRIASSIFFTSMNPVHLLLLALSIATTAEAQQTPPAGAPQATPPDAPPAITPVETVKPAIPVTPLPVPLPSDKPPTFTQDQVRAIETALKKEMMLVGMGSGVAGLLLGMMIGRKTAPRSTGRRF
jgi:hypothetical protein